MLPFTRPSLGEAEFDAVRKVLESGWITTGPNNLALEQALADYIGNGIQVRLLNSGTSALEAALLASDIGPGDEVIIPAMSFVATANVVLRVGARPVFVDVGLHSRNLDAARVAAAISEKTRAIIPVHFAGLAVDIDPLYQLAQDKNLVLIEDAAQAIGTEYKGRKIGASGNPVCFSFHPNKNMTTIEGGAIACNNSDFIRRIERIRFHGIERADDGSISVTEWGGKMNLPDVGAALGLTQLARLDNFNRKRRQLAEHYFQHLRESEVLVLPTHAPGHSWHMFCICIDHTRLGTGRAEIQKRLQEQDIGTGIHYPAMHLFPLYQRYGYKSGDFPNAERIGEQTLTLPLFPAMKLDDVDRVCDALKNIIST
ncbi:MAG TPA: DegT/DnrJ/EryC1/StrS aminotransferase family protein [Gammaproteobacteria bacterium]|nr:DegT/DnrJ/EryC1/StrS aminotransferase family protein [Gammaproteobacteria bacterium]